MTEPEAGPVAATKEGSDCDNPANSPPLFFFFFFWVIYHGRNLFSLRISIDLDVETHSLLQSPAIHFLHEEWSHIGEMFHKACHFITQNVIIFLSFVLTTSIILVCYIFSGCKGSRCCWCPCQDACGHHAVSQSAR